MSRLSPAHWLAAITATAALTAVAQTAPAASGPPPADPPALSYRSAFEGYQPYMEEKTIPWKEANETVYQRGGWRAYAKEASEESPSGGEAPKATSDPHSGHSMPMPVKKGQP